MPCWYLPGRLSGGDLPIDRASMYAAVMATLANVAAAFVTLAMLDLPCSASNQPALLFVLMIAYQGVRLGRSVHVVDMA